MTSLNRQRANIVFSALLGSDPELDVDSLKSGQYSYVEKEKKGKKEKGEEEEEEEKEWKILRPEEVARRERIFERDGMLRWTFESQSSASPSSSSSQILGSCRIGVPLKDLLFLLQKDSPFSISTSVSRSKSTSTSIDPHQPSLLPRLLDLFASESYLLYISVSASRTRTPNHVCNAAIVLKQNCTVHAQLKAWVHALLAARVISSSSSRKHVHVQKNRKNNADDHGEEEEDTFGILSRTLAFLNEKRRFERYLRRLAQEAGWDLDVAGLETRPGRRVRVG